MSGSQLIPTNTFATQSGNIALSLLDTNFSQVASFLNNPNNYTNYLVDSGGANAYVVTFPTGVIPSSYTAGLTVVMKVANANTGASTLNVNSLGTKNILNPDASSLSNGQLASGSLVMVVYDGTQFILLGGSATTTSTQSYNGFKNRIINGAMVIDQRNAGASVMASNSVTYTVDRFNSYGSVSSKYTVQQNAGSVTPPAGFTNYLGCTSSSAYSVGASEFFAISQNIEGFNTADFGWGTANAATVTLSFRVYSSLTGTFGGVIYNAAFNRSYPFTYTISSANTWTSISITIAGDTSGTWVGATNGVGLTLSFSLGAGATVSGTAGAWTGSGYRAATGGTSVVGTSGATFYITGVQLEKGSTATSFDYRPYGTELQLCQRYFQTWGGTTSGDYAPWSGLGYNSTTAEGCFTFLSTMRSAPSLTQVGNWYFNDAASDNAAGTLGIGTTALQTTQMRSATATGLTQYRPYTLRGTSTASRIQLSAEL